MTQLKESIVTCLQEIKGSGKFLSAGVLEFKFPGIEVDKVGELSYPIPAMQAKDLIKTAHKAPFGKGTKTLLDNKVRSAWEIDTTQISFSGEQWESYIRQIVKQIKPNLGLEGYKISAHLYKMLIYEKGDFFLPHKDSEKEKGMFGTLIVGLPSKHSGGELVVSFDGKQDTADFSATASYVINYAAFYADCDHEIRPVTSGYRVCLVYNLIQDKEASKIKLQSLSTSIDKLVALFIKDRKSSNRKPNIILLGHQYTPENFAKDSLKLDDRSKAEVMLQAAGKAGCYAKLCLVTSYINGIPEHDGYYDDDDFEDANMDIMEENIRELYIRDWVESELPPFSHLGFEESDLIASFDREDDEPLIKESTGYMGNYGPDIEHWYHYGAVIVWSPETNAALLSDQDMQCKLNWVRYFNQYLTQATNNEVSALTALLQSAPQGDFRDRNADYNAVTGWIISRGIKNFFSELGPTLCQFYFTHINANSWLNLLTFLPKKEIDQFVKQLTKDVSKEVFEQMLAVLCLLGKDKEIFLKAQLSMLPAYFTEINKSVTGEKAHPVLSRIAVDQLFQLESKYAQSKEWINEMSILLISPNAPTYMNTILVTALLGLPKKASLGKETLKLCKAYLKARVNNKPQPPADWARPVPFEKGNTPPWNILKAFLESPTEEVHHYKARQHERGIMEDAVRSIVVDIRMETIKRGSPQTLQLTKTSASYKRALKQWREDAGYLEKIELKK